MEQILIIYKKLLDRYGFQGWWPLLDCKGSNPTKTGSIQGYHPKDYSYPKNSIQQFEICIGAILTQNTAWPNVEKALINLGKEKLFDPKKMNNIKVQKLAQLIRPAGYFNQKAGYIKEFTRFFLKLSAIPMREQLLAVKGIGNETADSILLYAFSQPEFVVDAYTKRVFSKAGLISMDSTYMHVKDLFQASLPSDFRIYQEYHALIVEHAKQK
jgi:endonuclease III related protein